MILRIWLDCVIFAIIILSIIFVVIVVQSLSHVQLFETPWTAAHQTSPSLIISQSLLKFMSIESVMLSNNLILCHSLLLLPSIFPNIRVFSNELALSIMGPKYWSFTFSPSSEYSGLISFRIDRLLLLVHLKTSLFICLLFYNIYSLRGQGLYLFC